MRQNENPDKDYPSDVVVRTTDQSLIRVQEASSNNLILSFTHPDCTHTRQKGEQYFNDIIFDKEKWMSAVNLAIEEYFAIVIDKVKIHPNYKSNNIRIEYYNYRKAL